MRHRKQTAWKKSRTQGQIYGGRMHRLPRHGRFRRLHGLRAPEPGAETPILIEENASRDYFFPLDGRECLAALRALPADDRGGLTHLWLRRPTREHLKRNLASYVGGAGVFVIVVHAWRRDRRYGFGATSPTGSLAKEMLRFGARLVREQGLWFAEFDEAALRAYCVYVLYHEVGHHLDYQARRWSRANRKQREDAADQYAARHAATAAAVLRRLQQG